MSIPETIAAALIGWVAVVLAIRWIIIPILCRGPGGDPILCLMWIGARIYVSIMHRPRWIGQESLRRKIHPGPLIVVSNHTCAVDPVLIQTGCWFSIRWLMAADMMIRELDWVWKQQKIIPVSRDGGDSGPVREAMRHVRAGGVIGIFPEGRIVKPRGEIRPFFSGVGAIVARTGAPVLLVWVSGTPDTERMSESFMTRSSSRVEFIEAMRFDGERDAETITQKIRERFSSASGWPLNDEPMPASM